ncbi:MAG: hypothetical protein RMJ15_03630 [Nitrososphaerota archaeon]|nr:hypothetical protein [Candidatus Bathyarchaeota archaeon]MDW8022817.1 hypothetical protein [Nitrososphaerota archaeon]
MHHGLGNFTVSPLVMIAVKVKGVPGIDKAAHSSPLAIVVCLMYMSSGGLSQIKILAGCRV